MTLLEQRMANLRKMQANLEQNAAEWIEVRSNEAMTTWQNGYGQDFVPTDLASMILTTARNTDSFYSKLGAPIIMPSSVYTIPVEWTDPTWYASSEQANVTATAVTTSKAGTGDIVLTAKKYSMSTYTSGELDEDSIINIKSYISDKIGVSYAELLDKIWYNGDTTTDATGNVNMDDEAPTAGSYFLHQNGLFYSAIANSMTVNAGTLDLADIRGLRKLMGLKGLDPSKLLLIPNTDTYFKLLALTQAETMEKFGWQATVLNGRLAAIDGIEVMPTSLFGNAEADGKLSYDTPSNNTLGRMLLVYKPDLLHGFKRNIQVFTDYLPEYDQYRFTAHFRYAIKLRATNSATAAINITVA